MAGRAGSSASHRVSRRTSALVASSIGAAAGLAVVLGWATGTPWLQAGLLPGPAVKANAGVSVLLLGVAALLCLRPGASQWRRRLTIGLAGVAGFIAIVTIVEHVARVDLWIDNLLFRQAPGAPDTASPGQMALGSAIGIALLAGAIARLAVVRERSRLVGWLASVGATLAAITLLGDLYGSAELTGIGAGTVIAPGGAAALAAIAIGVLAGPRVAGPFDVLARSTFGGRVARGFALASLVILPMLGLIGRVGVRAGLFGPGFEISLITAVGAAILVTVGVVFAGRFDRLATQIEGQAATLSAILDASPPAIIALDADARVTYWSRGAEHLYGWTARETVGRPAPHFPAAAAPDLAEQWRRVRAGESVLREETVRMAKSGELIDVAISVAPLRDADGHVTGLLAVQEDMRGRKRLEAELIESHQLQTVGRLAGGIAHHFNNLLTAITGYTTLSLEEPLEPTVRANLEAVELAAERARVLTQQILAFGQRQSLRIEPLEVGDLLRGFAPVLRQILGDRVELTILVDPGTRSFEADEAQVQRVLVNLALNARDAMPDGGSLLVRAAARSVTESNLPHAEMPAGDYVVISVTDTGSGMDQATQAHIFEPFFTTKEVGRGAGLGLSTSYGIVKQLGGEIVVESSPGAGSTFHLFFRTA